jgi:peptidyl-prolyl cis-trans isomerase D
MLGFVRSLMKSKWGVVVTLGFVALIALAFAGGDIANTGSFGGVAGGDRVAVVGGERIDTGELNTSARNAFDRAREQNPTLTMQAFMSAETLGRVLDDLVGRVGIAEFAERYGLRAGKRLVDSEIVQIPQFRDANGNFDNEAFVAILQQRGLSEAQVREDFAQGLLARQILTPVELGSTMPASVAKRYVALLRESRSGAIAILPSAAYAPTGVATDAQLQAYYKTNSAAYIRPERRVLRYAKFNDTIVSKLPAPTDAQIKAYYDANAVRYAASERRSFTQLVVPTQQAAEAIRREIAGGKSLDQAAREKGLSTAKVALVAQTQLSNQASAAVAQAGFGAAQGALTAPTRGGLGWYLLRIDAIERTAARSLAAARGEIITTLAAQQKRDALTAVTVAIEDEIDGGASLAEIAKEHGLTLTDTLPITADGRVYGAAGTVPAELQPVLSTAFAMEEQEPQLAQVIPGEAFAIYEAAEITPSAAAPFAEIRAGVEVDWRKAQGDAAAKIAADRVLKRLQGGATLAAALAAENRTLPAPDEIAMKREQLTQMASQGRVPAPLALLFSMAAGTEKRLEAPLNNGWFIVQLDGITPGQVPDNDPLLARSRLELGPTVGGEYSAQFVKAILDELKVERNQSAFDAVLAQLSGRDAQ